ncbi:MAG: haloacid dehalogenase [Chloroflexia bacterium]
MAETSPTPVSFEEIAEGIRAELARQDRLREEALVLSRQVIRAAALSIRATHRQEFAEAERRRSEAHQYLLRLHEIVAACPFFSALGYIADAEKEYAEACLTYALIREQPIPPPEELAVPVAPYLNALGEAVGELRRAILDALRQDLLSPCEARLEAMQQIYDFLVTVDFPEALTGGLRRTTDMVRRVLENTRADLTLALRQRKLQQALEEVEGRLS